MATVLMGAGYWTTPNADSVSYYLSNEKLSFQNAGKPSIFSNFGITDSVSVWDYAILLAWWP